MNRKPLSSLAADKPLIRSLFPPNGLQLRNQTDTPTIYIYDEIGKQSLWGDTVSAKDIIAALEAIGDVPEIDVRINSPGGDVFEGDAIYNALVRSRAKISIYIDGVAASAASYIAMAGDSIEIAENAMIMIHEAWTITWGNKHDIAHTHKLLEKIDGTLATMYAARSGKTVEEAGKWMEDETWFSAEEALAAKIVDRIGTALKTPPEAAAKAVARYAKAPAALKATVAAAQQSSTPTHPRLNALKQRIRNVGWAA